MFPDRSKLQQVRLYLAEVAAIVAAIVGIVASLARLCDLFR